MKKGAFLKWLLYVSLISVGFVVFLCTGTVKEIIVKDSSYLCITMLVWFVVSTFQTGVATYQVDKVLTHSPTHKKLKKKLLHVIERNHFSSGALTALGMVGTVVGFCMMLPSFATVNVGEPATVQNMIKELVLGMSTALYTTLVGLVLATLLRLLNFNLSSVLDQHSTDSEVLA